MPKLSSLARHLASKNKSQPNETDPRHWFFFARSKLALTSAPSCKANSSALVLRLETGIEIITTSGDVKTDHCQ